MATALVEKVHQEQQLRHVLANKLTLALTVLRQLEDGKPVGQDTLRRARRDLDTAIKLVDSGERVPSLTS